MLTRKGLPD
jgi:SAM-dependent methyltransferase